MTMGEIGRKEETENGNANESDGSDSDSESESDQSERHAEDDIPDFLKSSDEEESDIEVSLHEEIGQQLGLTVQQQRKDILIRNND